MCNEKEIPLAVNLVGTDITKAVAQSILDSVIGDEIKKAIETLSKDQWGRSRIVETAVKSAVEKHLHSLTLKLLRESEDQIKAMIRTHLTDDVFTKIIGQIIDGLTGSQ